MYSQRYSRRVLASETAKRMAAKEFQAHDTTLVSFESETAASGRSEAWKLHLLIVLTGGDVDEGGNRLEARDPQINLDVSNDVLPRPLGTVVNFLADAWSTR